MIITNHDATTMMLDLMVPSPDTNALTHMNYDRIVCDVPCSGLRWHYAEEP